MKLPSEKLRRIALGLVFGFVWLTDFLHKIVEPSWLWALGMMTAFFAFTGLTELLARIYIRYGPDL